MTDSNLIYMADARNGERFAVHLFGGSAFSQLEGLLAKPPIELDVENATVIPYRIPYEQLANILDKQLNRAELDPCYLGSPEIEENYCYFCAEFWASGKDKVIERITPILNWAKTKE